MPVGAITFVAMRSHGDDSASATQVISVVDGDDASFFLIFSVQASTSSVVFLSLDPLSPD